MAHLANEYLSFQVKAFTCAGDSDSLTSCSEERLSTSACRTEEASSEPGIHLKKQQTGMGRGQMQRGGGWAGLKQCPTHTLCCCGTTKASSSWLRGFLHSANPLPDPALCRGNSHEERTGD